MAVKKNYLGHKTGDVVRWYLHADGNIKLSDETGILKGWDTGRLKWIVKTKDGEEVYVDFVCKEAERLKYWEDISNAYSNGFRDGLKHAREEAYKQRELMNVYIFNLDKDNICGIGQVIVAAHNPEQAWDCVKQELGWEAGFFNPQKYEQVHSLTSLLNEPAVITYNCYVE